MRQFGKRFDKDFVLPELSKESFRDRVSEVIDVENSQATAVFFTGCSVNYFYPDVGEDLLFVLRKNKVKSITPKQQNCCGMPVMVHGDIETARELAKKNLDIFEKKLLDNTL